MSYYCENEEKCFDKYGFRGLSADMFHMDRCTCLLGHAYDFFMGDQSDHIRAYWEDKGTIVKWSTNYGIVLSFKDILKHFTEKNKSYYPYPNDVEMKRLDELPKRFKMRKKASAARRRAHKLLIWRR